MKTLALDPSTTCTGWAVFSGKSLKAFGEIRPPRKYKDASDRISYIVDEVVRLVIDEEIGWVVSEEPLHSIGVRGGVRQVVLAWRLYGNIEAIAQISSIPFESAPIRTWRKACGIKGNRAEAKRGAINFVTAVYKENVGEDVSEAICIGHWAVSQ